MKLEQIQEDKSGELARATRRYHYLANKRIDPDLGPTVRIYDKWEDVVGRTSEKVTLSVHFEHAPWLNTFKNHFDVNSNLPDKLKPQAQKAVEVFAEKFADEHGIPYTRIDCKYMLTRITYFYE